MATNVFSLRDTYGAGLRDRQAFEAGKQQNALLATQNRRANALLQQEERQLGEEERRKNTEWLGQSADYVLRLDPGQREAAIPSFIAEGKRRGIVDPNFSGTITENELNIIARGAQTALGGPQQAAGSTIIPPAQAQQYGFDPGTVLERTAQGGYEVLQRPQSPETVVNLNSEAESESNKVIARMAGEQYSSAVNEGMAAAEQRDTLMALRDNPAVTGPTQDVRAAATALFSDLGVPVSEQRLSQIANLQQYKGAVNNLVLQELMKQKGPQTEGDAQRARSTFSSTENIGEANRLILNYRLALIERQMQRADFAEQWRIDHEGSVQGWEKGWREYMRQTPLSGFNKSTGKLVFFNEYLERMREANPGASDDEILDQWRADYAESR